MGEECGTEEKQRCPCFIEPAGMSAGMEGGMPLFADRAAGVLTAFGVCTPTSLFP